jgi:tetratricopeptide (TPR) repeat protein/peroxiredoxin
VQEFQDLPVNHRVFIEEGNGKPRLEAFTTVSPTSEAKADNPQSSIYRSAEALRPSSIAESTFSAAVETWLLAPIAAPDFSLPDLSGQPRSLIALRGKPVLLNFWTTVSPSCKEDLETFSRFHKHWSEEGLQLLAVNVDEPHDVDKMSAFVRARQFSLPILRGTDDVASIYNILYRYLFDRHRDMSLPASFLISSTGEIVKVYQGPINPEHVEYDFRNIPRTPAERLGKALPFPGVPDTSDFKRNYLSFGAVYFQREYFDQAEVSFQLALRDDPTSAEALYGLGSVYLKQQKTSQAWESFVRATKVRASYPETLPNAWNNLGLLAMREEHTADAIQYFQEALQKNPRHLIALNNLGNAYRQQKQWDEARKVLERAIQVSPQDPEANYSLGMVFAQLDDSDRAYEYLQKALKFRPGYPEALNNLGVLYLRTQRRDEAVASFEECIRVAPAFDQAYLNLARVYAIENTPEKAKAVLQELLKQHPDHTAARTMLEQLPQ